MGTGTTGGLAVADGVAVTPVSPIPGLAVAVGIRGVEGTVMGLAAGTRGVEGTVMGPAVGAVVATGDAA